MIGAAKSSARKGMWVRVPPQAFLLTDPEPLPPARSPKRRGGEDRLPPSRFGKGGRGVRFFEVEAGERGLDLAGRQPLLGALRPGVARLVAQQVLRRAEVVQ